MKSNYFYLFILIITFITTGASISCNGGASSDDDDDTDDFSITSSEASDGFDDGDTIPTEFACTDYDGSNELPTLTLSNAPSGTNSFAITVVDSTSSDIHMVLFDIPSTPLIIDDEDDYDSSNFATNYNSNRGYDGPCPPEGEAAHTYVFTAYAMPDAALTVDDPTDADAVITAIQANDLATDSISGTFAAP